MQKTYTYPEFAYLQSEEQRSKAYQRHKRPSRIRYIPLHTHHFTQSG